MSITSTIVVFVFNNSINVLFKDVFKKSITWLATSYRKSSKQRSSALCLQAKGVMLDFWNEAIENQLTLQHRALKMQNRETGICFILPCLNFGQHSANKVKRMNPPYFKFQKKKTVTKTLSFSNDWIQMNSQCNRKCVQFKLPEAEREK